MDVKKYFDTHFSKDEKKFAYYTDLLNLFDMDNFAETSCVVIDEDDLIRKWKECLTESVSEPVSNDVSYKFMLYSFYLYNNDYIIKEHPGLLKNIKNYKDLSDTELKLATGSKYGNKGNVGGVAWRHRRQYIDELSIVRKPLVPIPPNEDIDSILSRVSPRNANFNEMPLDEKLAEIRNAYEYIAFENERFIQIDFKELSCGMISEENAKTFSKKLHAFRHGKENALQERSSYSKSQKEFLVDYGITLLHLVARFKKE